MPARAEFVCPACRATISAPASLEGEAADCPRCETSVPAWPSPVNKPAPVITAPLPTTPTSRLTPTLPPLPTPPPPTRRHPDNGPDEEDEPKQRTRRRIRRRPNSITPLVVVGLVLVTAVGALVFVAIAWSVWLPDPGTRLTFNGGELFYTNKTTKAEATRLGNYLVKTGFFNGDFKSVQLTREGRWYQVRMVVKTGNENDLQFLELVKVFATELSREVFDGQPVEIHLCDPYFKTLRVVVNPFG